MTDPVAFLRARVDEDEAAARACESDPPWSVSGVEQVAGDVRCADVTGRDPDDGQVAWDIFASDADHIARHDPARVLREVEAKRRIMDGFLSNAAWAEDPHCPDDQRAAYRQAAGTFLDACWLHTAVYSDHPDYDPEWAV